MPRRPRHRLSPVATRLLEAVRERPGISTMGLARHLGVARTTVRHHVRALVARDLLRVARRGKIPTLFVAASGVTSRSILAGTDLPSQNLEVLAHDVRRLVCDFADLHGVVDHCSFTSWAAENGLRGGVLSASGFRYHCAILERAGLLRRSACTWELAPNAI